METIHNQDKNTILDLIENDPYMYIWNVSEELRNDPDVVLAFAKKTKDAMVIEYAGKDLKNNKDFLMQVASCDENGYDIGLVMALKYAGDKIKNDRQFFVEVLQRNGHLRSFWGDSIKDDIDLNLISVIEILGRRFYNNTNTFEEKVNLFLSRIKNGVSVRGEEKSRPYSFKVELENYEARNNFRPGIDDAVQEQSVFIKESPEEIERQLKLLGHIKEISLKNSKEQKNQTKSSLQQREEELSILETEEKIISEAESLIDKQTQKEGQDIGEN